MISVPSFIDELEKIAGHIDVVSSLAAKLKNLGVKNLKTPALIGGGAGGALAGKQAYEDWSLGRQIRKQHRG